MNYSSLPSNRFVRFSLLFLLLCIMAFACSTLYIMHYLQTPIASLQQTAVFEVKAGSSLSRVAHELESDGYIRFPQFFKVLGRWRGVAGAVKAGEYELEPGLSPAQLLTVLVSGSTRQYRITLLEGWTVRQALEAIWKGEKVQRQLAGYDPQRIAEVLQVDKPNPEGLLFPDTYFYTAGTTDIDLLRRANTRLNDVLDAAWKTRLGALPFETAYEALILASIVEKESAFGAERGHIAGVFVRRLELGMRLQSDPTVIYGLGEQFDGNLTRENLSATTDYNTYRIPALPPTPIALAGLDSITASLHPLPSSYLYFVSKGNGEHHFSSTLEEHNAAVREYQTAMPQNQ